MKKGGSSATGGFTIVETLIVLAVTSALLISALVLINGKQNKTQFMVGINDFKQRIQQLINQTASGYFPNFNNYTCTGTTSQPYTVQLSATASEQGTNSNCVFLGRVILFAQSINNQSAMVSYTIAGNAQAAGVMDQLPAAIAHGNKFNTSFVQTDTVVDYAENGLTVQSMTYVIGAAAPVKTGTVAFLAGTSAGGYTPQTGQSGALSQQLSLYTVKGTDIKGASAGPANVTDQIDGGDPTNPQNNFLQIDEASICMASGSTNQSGLITISGSGSLAVTLEIKDGTTTCGA